MAAPCFCYLSTAIPVKFGSDKLLERTAKGGGKVNLHCPILIWKCCKLQHQAL